MEFPKATRNPDEGWIMLAGALVGIGVYTAIFPCDADASMLQDNIDKSVHHTYHTELQLETEDIWFPIVLDEEYIRVYRQDLPEDVAAFVQDYGDHSILVLDDELGLLEILNHVVHESNHLAKMYINKHYTYEYSTEYMPEVWEREAYIQEEIFRQFMQNLLTL